MRQCDSCHTVTLFLPTNVGFVPKKPQPTVPKCVCINLSHSHGESKTKKWDFIKEIWAFHQVDKKCQKRDFSIFNLIFENLPINLGWSTIPQKKLQTFLYQNIPQPGQ